MRVEGYRAQPETLGATDCRWRSRALWGRSGGGRGRPPSLRERPPSSPPSPCLCGHSEVVSIDPLGTNPSPNKKGKTNKALSDILQAINSAPSCDDSVVQTPDVVKDKLYKKRLFPFGLWKEMEKKKSLNVQQLLKHTRSTSIILQGQRTKPGKSDLLRVSIKRQTPITQRLPEPHTRKKKPNPTV